VQNGEYGPGQAAAGASNSRKALERALPGELTGFDEKGERHGDGQQDNEDPPSRGSFPNVSLGHGPILPIGRKGATSPANWRERLNLSC
jgi:hypothetical protein